jgi:hypothetical protein
MMLAPLLTLAALAASPPAPAEEAPTCALNENVLRSQFSPKLPKGFKLLSTKRDKKARRISQELQLPEGTKVTISVGGCEHLGITFAIRNPALTTKTVGAEVVAVCKRVLPQLPVEKDAAASPKLFLKALDEANIVAMPNQLPCGDAVCQVALEPDEPKARPGKPPKGKKPEPKDPEAVKSLEEGPAYIRLSYDFAL